MKHWIGWLPWLLAALLLIGRIEEQARWRERLALAQETTRRTAEQAAQVRQRLDSLRQLADTRAAQAAVAHARASTLAQVAALRAETLATLRDSLLRALPAASPERAVIEAEHTARLTCEERARSCEGLVQAMTGQLAASDSARSVERTQARQWQALAERQARALRRAMRPWAVSFYLGFGASQTGGAGWQIGIGLTRTLVRLPPW